MCVCVCECVCVCVCVYVFINRSNQQVIKKALPLSRPYLINGQSINFRTMLKLLQ